MASCTINNAMKICNRDTSTAKVQKRCLHLQMQQYAFHHGLYSIWWQTQEHILITHDMKLSRGTLTGHKDTRFTNRKAEMQKQPNNKSVDRLKALPDQMKPREKYKTHRSTSIPETSSHNFFCLESKNISTTLERFYIRNILPPQELTNLMHVTRWNYRPA